MGSNRRFGPLVVFTTAAFWLIVCGAGLWVLLQYQIAPGEVGPVSARWPNASSLRRVPGANTLVLFAHPRCPCTRASIDSLARTMARSQGKLAAYALFYKPAGVPDGWEKTDLWRAASRIPGVAVSPDDDGVEARRFGAQTSGQAFLYDSQGKLRFHGGITGSRGHFGDNAGLDSVVSIARGGEAERDESRVFGCALLRAEAERRGFADSWRMPEWIRAIARR